MDDPTIPGSAESTPWEDVRARYWEDAGLDGKEEDMARVARLEVERWLLGCVARGEYEFAGVNSDGETTYRARRT